MKNILSIGISTGGSAEIKMAKKCPNAKIIATTIDEKELKFSKEKISEFKEKEQIEVKLEDISKSMESILSTLEKSFDAKLRG